MNHLIMLSILNSMKLFVHTSSHCCPSFSKVKVKCLHKPSSLVFLYSNQIPNKVIICSHKSHWCNCTSILLVVKYLKTSLMTPWKLKMVHTKKHSLSLKWIQAVYLIKTFWDSFMNHMEMVVQLEPGSGVLYQLMFDECQTHLIGKPFCSGCSFAFSKTKTKAACCISQMNRRFPEPWNGSMSAFFHM